MLIQITGLPRSGTAFLSAFLSLHPECIAYHELVNYEDNYRLVLTDALKRYPYVVDCSTYGYLDGCVYQESKKVLIQRPMQESLRRSEVVMGAVIAIEKYEELVEKIEEWTENNDVLTVDFSRLFTPTALSRIWEFCFGSSDYFSREKAELFCRLNIQMQAPQQLYNQKNIERILTQIV